MKGMKIKNFTTTLKNLQSSKEFKCIDKIARFYIFVVDNADISKSKLPLQFSVCPLPIETSPGAST